MNTPATDALHFFDRKQLKQLATRMRESYQMATPIPHLVIDNFFPDEIARLVSRNFPPLSSKIWSGSGASNPQRMHKWLSIGEEHMSPFLRQQLSQLQSTAILDFLESLTGEKGLIPDRDIGRSLRRWERGGKLGVHIDFNRDGRRQLSRRINLLLYMTPEWLEEYGGHLEFWDADMKQCITRILPKFNRAIIFRTGPDSPHGVPDPIRCPSHLSRDSIQFYYYTATELSDKAHSTRFLARPGESAPASTLTSRHIIKQLSPPILLNVMRKLRSRYQAP